MIRRMLCRLGRHSWEHRHDEAGGGRDAGFDVCRHCHTERNEYGPHAPGSIPNMGGGG